MTDVVHSKIIHGYHGFILDYDGPGEGLLVSETEMISNMIS